MRNSKKKPKTKPDKPLSTAKLTITEQMVRDLHSIADTLESELTHISDRLDEVFDLLTEMKDDEDDDAEAD